MRQLPVLCRNASQSSPRTDTMPCRAKYKSTPNAVSPNAPSGTRPISTRRPDIRSHSSAPAPVPIENKVNTNVLTEPSPPSVSRV